MKRTLMNTISTVISCARATSVLSIAVAIVSATVSIAWATTITITEVAGFPNGRVSNDPPPNAVDGDINTFTWTTESGNSDSPSHLAIGFAQTTVNRLRLWKDNNGGGGENIKNLMIQYTTDTGPLETRSWTTVSGLSNGFQGAELLHADAVNPNGEVIGDIHNSLGGDGWASLTFKDAKATGLRISFSNPNLTDYPNHYRVGELQALFGKATVPGTAVTLTFSSGPAWKAFSGDPGLTSFSQGQGFIGPAQAVCPNEYTPWPCPDGAVLYGYPGGGWPADLSRIPTAVWIWAPNVTGDTGPAEFASFFFSDTFILAGHPTRGVIYVAADDFAEVRVNGAVVGTIGSVTDIGLASDAQSYLHEFDISSFLKPGRNTITIEGQNGPPAFAGCWGGCTYSQNPAGVVFGGSLSFMR